MFRQDLNIEITKLRIPIILDIRLDFIVLEISYFDIFDFLIFCSDLNIGIVKSDFAVLGISYLLIYLSFVSQS